MRALLAAALLLALPASGQSLAEAAQKEKERRAKAKEKGAAAVVTEDALKANKGALANDPKAASAALPTTNSPPRPRATPEPDRRALEEEWRRRMALAREQLARWQEYHDAWSQQHLAPNEYFVDENGRKLVGNAENLRKLIAHAKANLDAAKQALEDLEQQARRENVPPGWLR